ncbi:hypothetical protein AB0C02_17880 [Micromonospora sp. NPDC048999]|uniref:hypothetical protein n=1 Tax=Micromonospora sp. NPDC048999 TaxID=3155391 RepID=UPI0033F6F9C8
MRLEGTADDLPAGIRLPGILRFLHGKRADYVEECSCIDGSLVSLTWFEGAINIKGHCDGDLYREFGTFAEDGGCRCRRVGVGRGRAGIIKPRPAASLTPGSR